MRADKMGRIVWHDLFSSDRQRSMAFYRRIAGWDYMTEHATDFAWGGGEKDFVLALRDGEAGAGVADTPDALPNGWIAYVEVRDVDTAVASAERLGGTIVRPPFEVSGVGRNALVRDPLGALIGLALSRHDFPAPQKQFGVEIYLSDAPAFPVDFYAQVFGWTASSPTAGKRERTPILGPTGDDVALHLVGELPIDAQAMWLPTVKVSDPQSVLSTAVELGATPFSPTSPPPPAHQEDAFLCDPYGAAICLRRA